MKSKPTPNFMKQIDWTELRHQIRYCLIVFSLLAIVVMILTVMIAQLYGNDLGIMQIFHNFL